MTSYPAQSIYRAMALVSLIVAGLFTWDLAQGFEPGSLLFFAVSIGAMGWSIRLGWTRTTLTPEQLVVEPPLTSPIHIEYGQILSVSEEGRMTKSIVVAYHPRTADGLLDLDRAKAISLPAVQNQEALYEELVRRSPA